MRREEIEPLRGALIERPLLAALARDELPELEVLARDVIGSLVHLHLVPAAHETDRGRLECLEPSEGGKKIAAQLAAFVGSRSGRSQVVAALLSQPARKSPASCPPPTYACARSVQSVLVGSDMETEIVAVPGTPIVEVGVHVRVARPSAFVPVWQFQLLGFEVMLPVTMMLPAGRVSTSATSGTLHGPAFTRVTCFVRPTSAVPL